ncbi:leucine-rich repeat and immunoglobulin-like domain-containing nogo receptor-interacting protein 4 [Drosophila novamexicana]|uniref:leucine-rich repeat and immunoglobulin-like domain-containing nogo receptor-interacting protein 4 n=1 Tax=Drosophila novamexicana TaxID=47314 RepID=UPI0011E5A00F|nr:leucine-rich repeat and immunoglobulin-like domain-containing nogo receptor-interacting protein 4 [Drosophila novamexicana]
METDTHRNNKNNSSNTTNSHTKWRQDSKPPSLAPWPTALSWLPVHLLPLLLLLLLLPGRTNAFCPSKCQCLGGDANSRALCVDAALEDVPIQLNPETKYINLTLNRIRNLEFTLPFYMKLEVLDLSQNIIETLGSKNFEYQTELRTLNLSRNLVSALHKHAFKGLTNILLLDLSYNRIETVHPTALGDLAALVELDFTNNNIVSLEDNCFKGMLSLEVLVFRNNRLLDVPASNLWHLHALKSLDMSDNLVEYVRNDSFEGLKELLALSVRGNVMSELDVGAFEGLISLKHLDLSDNNLTMVPTQQLSKLSNLTYLNLGGNRFAHLPAVAFLNLFHLRELHLSRLDYLQRIDSRAFVDNTHLQTLHLNFNPQLSDIPMRLFQGNPNILEVYMQSNSLQTLYSAQFPVDQLQKLYLGDNPLQCNCSLLWLWRLVTGNFEGSEPPLEHAPGGAVAALAKEASLVREEDDTTLKSDDGVSVLAAYIAEQHIANALQTTEPSAYEQRLEAAASSSSSSSSGYLRMDKQQIGCDIWRDTVRTRRQLMTMSEGEITCPAHIVTVVCAVITSLLVLMIGVSVLYYMRFVKRRRKLLHERGPLRTSKSIINVHDRILQGHHQPLGSGAGMSMTLGGSGPGGLGMALNYPHHAQTLQAHHHYHQAMPLQAHTGGGHHEYQQTTLPQLDKLELERYLAAQTIANEYRALKPWELPVKEADDEPEHLYERFDHYEYPDTHTMTKLKQAAALQGSAVAAAASAAGAGAKPHVVYV